MTAPQDRTPIPRVQHRKGFAWLPLEHQLSVFALVAALVLACLPLLIDSGRAGGGQLKHAMLRPRSVTGAVSRLERHLSLRWWQAGSTGEQRLRQRLLLGTLGLCTLGAVVSSKAQAAPTPATSTSTTTTPRHYGTTRAIRARSATTSEEESHGQ
jgi:hypothetical protein